MRTPFLPVILACASVAHAQSTFEKYYVQAGATATMTINEQSSGNLVTGISRGITNSSGISIMSPEGVIIHSHCYDNVPFTVIQSFRKRTDNEFYFAGGYLHDSCAVDATLEVNPVIGKLDSLGNMLSIHHYQLNAVTCSNTAWDLTITSDGGAVAWGRPESFFALRVDPVGVPLWSRQFERRGSFGFVRELPDGNLLAGINMDTAGMVVARLDASGNFLWCKSYFRPKGKVYDCLVESDSAFVITGATDSLASGNQKLFMMKLNGSGEVQWCRGYHNPQYWIPYARIARTIDNEYVVLANVLDPGPRPLLMKTDQNGDTLWTRSAGVGGYSHYATTLLPASDGGFFYDGASFGDFGPGSSAVYLFKTDTLGDLPCSGTPPPTITVSDLFPVDSSFTLTSIDGAVAYPITNTDIPCDSIAVYDGCTITSVHKSPMVRHGNRMSVRPNPNTGRFTVEFRDPLQAGSYYSVYDAMGKLLYQRPLPPGATMQEVDLSRFGKGTYVIKCTDPEGVSYERVVVE